MTIFIKEAVVAAFKFSFSMYPYLLVSFSLLLIQTSGFSLVIAASDPMCPDILQKLASANGAVNCERIKCSVNVTKEDCPKETFFVEKLSLCGCCPGCASYIGIPSEPFRTYVTYLISSSLT
jgi:hypothetical protein